MDSDAIDFVMVAWREDGVWRLDVLPPRSGESLAALIEALGAQDSDAGALGFVAVAEEFFVIARLQGAQCRLLLSDVGAACDWPLAVEVVERLGLPRPDDVELDEITPAGDLTIVSDWGMSGAELAMLCEDIALYPDEVLGSVASRLGFGDQFESAIDDIDARKAANVRPS